ncbi:MAG: hypothetical protein JXR60_01430 [Bacteroidales bacterium]|nr:hypothetical protein [Bacteroidales bacterium]
MTIKNKNGFKIPEGYFDTLSNKVQDKILSEQNTSHSIFYRPSYWVAASIIAIVISGVGYFHFFENSKSNYKNNNIVLSDLEYYDFNMDDLYYAYNENSITDESIEELDAKSLEEYIVDEVNINDILIFEEQDYNNNQQ